MKKQLINIILAAFILGVAGCSKNFLNINNNPNSATTTTPELVLPAALTTTASTQLTAGFMPYIQCWMGYWAISGSYAISNSDPASYYQNTGFGDGTWQGYYHNLNDYNYIEQTALKENKPFYAGAAKIMKAYLFQQLVDMFNNVPYSQAFQGTNIIQPKYDNGVAVYTAIEAQIDSAVALMSNPSAVGEATATSDIMFGGDPAAWIQFANTLQLRILMRQSQASGGPINLSGELANITANGQGFLTADAGVNPGYANNSGEQNPVWGFFVTLTNQQTTGGAADYYRGNSYGINWMQTNNDTVRLKFLYSPGGTGFLPNTTLANTLNGTYTSSDYVGNQLGLGNAGLGGNGASSAGPGILQSVGQNAILMTAAESYFLQAEAALYGWTGFTGAGALMNQGVVANFTSLGDPNAAADAAALTSQNNVNTNYNACNTNAQRLACIIRQKWEAMNEVTPFEAWCDWRRLGLPADISTAAHSVSPAIDNPPTIPVRILYPASEYITNATNVNAQGTINCHTSKVWWNQ
jgi:hypothetical protein